MSLKRWALSVFFVWHLTAITLGSLASPGAVAPAGPPRHPTNNAIAAGVTPVLDELAAFVAPVPSAVLGSAGWMRRIAFRYLQISGVHQSWKMFSNPPLVNEYLLVRYYVGPRLEGGTIGARPVWTAAELVFPAHREDQIRLFHSYWDGYRDKAMAVALSRFHENRRKTVLRPDAKSSELPDDLAPICRYFARRFEGQALGPDERILRTEIWYGMAPMPLPGEPIDSSRTEARASVLRDYYQGPVEDHLGTPVYPPYYGVQDQADIRWVLEYFEP